MTKRMKPDARRDQLLAAALDEAEEVGYNFVRRDDVGQRVGVTGQLVMRYFGTMTQLRRDIVRAAIRQRRLPIIAEALAARSSLVADIPDDLRAEALASLS